jgi:hypothetical protein
LIVDSQQNGVTMSAPPTRPGEEAAAVARRQAGQDVVVCGDDTDVNRRLAEQIEARVGPYVRSAPHKRSAGPRALPHFQQQSPTATGHTFYETTNLRAARRKP